ncbi:MAG: dihydrodipicolinate synthase family protein [Gemmatimonadaceae bacterium]
MATNTLSGIMVPAVTPFTASGELDRSAFIANLRAHLSFGMSGILVTGSSGEAALLDDTEREALVEWARDVVPADKWLLAGIGAESTRQTINRAKVAHRAGADAVLVVAPHYYLKRTTEAALSAHYQAIADASPVPVMLYNIPGYAHLVLQPSLIHEMAKHPNVIGMKDSAGNLPMLTEYLGAASEKFRVLTGSGATVVPALKSGAAGAILAIALFAGPMVLAMHAAQMAGDDVTAAGLQLKLAPLAMDIGAALGPAGIKAAMDVVGLAGGPPRSPLQPASAEEMATIRARMETAGLLPA